jgi:hypothetical protein
MPKFIVEREIPGAGKMSAEQLHGVACTSNDVLAEMAGPYHWVQSFVTDNKIYCVHIAPNEETVREHARRGGFPADRIERVQEIIDPTTGEELKQHATVPAA